MEMQPVASEVIAAIGYEADHGLLVINFHNGSVYEYYMVPRATFEAFADASSKGTFFRERIQEGGFAFRCTHPRES